MANLTASRVSQDRLRRIRFFQGDAYLSVDLFEKTCDLLHVDAARLRAVLAQAGPLAAAARGDRPAPARGRRRASRSPSSCRRSCGSLGGAGTGAASAEAGRAALAVAAEVRSAMKLRAKQWVDRASAAS